MRYYKCPDCKTFKEKADDIIMTRCACGCPMEEVDSKHYPLDTRTEPMKICDSNKCENCPIRGTECF